MVVKVRPNPPPRRPVYLWALVSLTQFPMMRKLQEFYRQYSQYIGTDGLMYAVFILVLGLMFLFFR